MLYLWHLFCNSEIKYKTTVGLPKNSVFILKTGIAFLIMQGLEQLRDCSV